MTCINRRGIHAKTQTQDGRPQVVYNCSALKLCTEQDEGFKFLGTETPIGICAGCSHFVDPSSPVSLDFTPLDLAPRKSDRVVVTLAVGDKFKELLFIARPTFHSYVRKCEADYVEIVLDKSDYPEGDKFRVGQLFDHGYKEVLFVDADCIIQATAENIFDVVSPDAAVAIHDDRRYLKSRQWLDDEYSRLIESQGWDMPQPFHCYNTGVMLIRDRRAIQMPDKPFPRSHTAEQSLINLNCARFQLPTYHLPRSWNEQWWWGGKLPERAGTHIYHWASATHKTRVGEMIARRDGVTLPETTQPRSEFAPCANLGNVIRVEACKPCHGSEVPIRSCDQFGECAPRRYKQVGQPHICDRQCNGFTQLVQLQPDLLTPVT